MVIPLTRLLERFCFVTGKMAVLYFFFQHDMTWHQNIFLMSLLKNLFVVYFDHMMIYDMKTINM